MGGSRWPLRPSHSLSTFPVARSVSLCPGLVVPDMHLPQWTLRSHSPISTPPHPPVPSRGRASLQAAGRNPQGSWGAVARGRHARGPVAGLDLLGLSQTHCPWAEAAPGPAARSCHTPPHPFAAAAGSLTPKVKEKVPPLRPSPPGDQSLLPAPPSPLGLLGAEAEVSEESSAPRVRVSGRDGEVGRARGRGGPRGGRASLARES